MHDAGGLDAHGSVLAYNAAEQVRSPLILLYVCKEN